MIVVRNRELLIPREEFNLGTNFDLDTETREFRINKVTQGGIDISNLNFRLDLKYANGDTDTAYLDKVYPDTDEPIDETETEENTKRILIIPPFPTRKPPKQKDNDYITLVLTVTKNMLQVPGTVLIQLRGYTADGLMKWTSYQGAFYVESAINTPTTYTGDLTELEQLEIKIDKVLDTEAERVKAEESREAAEEVREEQEAKRAETFTEAEAKREQTFTDAIDDFNRDRQELKDYANTSKSYAVGSTGTRSGENYDNAKYYCEQSKISADDSLNSLTECQKLVKAITPVFTIDFDDGELHYNDDCSYSFTVNTSTGNLEYELEEETA